MPHNQFFIQKVKGKLVIGKWGKFGVQKLSNLNLGG
jgi:hypothetical protein